MGIQDPISLVTNLDQYHKALFTWLRTAGWEEKVCKDGRSSHLDSDPNLDKYHESTFNLVKP